MILPCKLHMQTCRLCYKLLTGFGSGTDCSRERPQTCAPWIEQSLSKLVFFLGVTICAGRSRICAECQTFDLCYDYPKKGLNYLIDVQPQ